MASGCLKVTKYFLFLFNLLFFVSICRQNLNTLLLNFSTEKIYARSESEGPPDVAEIPLAHFSPLMTHAESSESRSSAPFGGPMISFAVGFIYCDTQAEILGAVILGFGIWILVDKTSFISVLQTSSSTSKVGAYILTGVGALTMLMGFLGCVGAVNEIRCLLGLYFTCLLLILIAQIAAGLLIYFQRNALEAEMSGIVSELVQNYDPSDENNRTLENAWDYVQLQLQCCGWTGPETWKNNTVLQERNQTLYPCSCSNDSFNSLAEVGFCSLNTFSNSSTVDDWPVKKQGCMKGVQNWLQDNLGIILGVCTGVAVIELLGMVLSICLCKNIHTEDYTKVPKY